MLNCSDCHELISAREDGTLTAAQATALAEHVGGCPSCAAELGRSSRISDTLRHFPSQPAPASLRAAVRETLRSEAMGTQRISSRSVLRGWGETWPAWSRNWSRQRPALAWGGSLVVAACLLIMLAGPPQFGPVTTDHRGQDDGVIPVSPRLIQPSTSQRTPPQGLDQSITGSGSAKAKLPSTPAKTASKPLTPAGVEGAAQTPSSAARPEFGPVSPPASEIGVSGAANGAAPGLSKTSPQRFSVAPPAVQPLRRRQESLTAPADMAHVPAAGPAVGPADGPATVAAADGAAAKRVDPLQFRAASPGAPTLRPLPAPAAPAMAAEARNSPRDRIGGTDSRMTTDSKMQAEEPSKATNAQPGVFGMMKQSDKSPAANPRNDLGVHDAVPNASARMAVNGADDFDQADSGGRSARNNRALGGGGGSKNEGDNGASYNRRAEVLENMKAQSRPWHSLAGAPPTVGAAAAASAPLPAGAVTSSPAPASPEAKPFAFRARLVQTDAGGEASERSYRLVLTAENGTGNGVVRIGGLGGGDIRLDGSASEPGQDVAWSGPVRKHQKVVIKLRVKTTGPKSLTISWEQMEGPGQSKLVVVRTVPIP